MTARGERRVHRGGAVSLAAAAHAQESSPPAPVTPQFIDRVDGLSLDRCGRPGAGRRTVARDRARADRRRKGPPGAGRVAAQSVRHFEQREEPGGTDTQTMLTVEWPLDLYRRTGRKPWPSRDQRRRARRRRSRARLRRMSGRGMERSSSPSASSGCSIARSTRPPGRESSWRAGRSGHDAATRARHGADGGPRLEADRLLQVGRAEAAMFELKRLLGMPADARLALRDTLEAVTAVEAASALPAAGEAPATGPTCAKPRPGSRWRTPLSTRLPATAAST